MIAALRDLTASYLAVVALLAVAAAAGVRCSPAVRAGVVVAEALLLAQAAVDLAWLAGGHRPADPPTHLGYVVASVALLPVLLGRRAATGRGPGSAPARTDHLVTAFACAATVVVVARLHATRA